MSRRSTAVSIGQQFGRLTVLGRPHRHRVPCQCDCGALRDVLASNLRAGSVVDCGNHDHGTADVPHGYLRVHRELAARRGSARAHTCAYCRIAPAQEWSLTADAEHLYDQHGSYPYSPLLSDYVPACIPCHRRQDAQTARRLEAQRHGQLPLELPGIDNVEPPPWVCS